MSSKPINVFGYLNYRKFLSDYYKRQKRDTRTFSFRAFSRRAGLKSPNHLKRVMDGERNLGDDTAYTYARVIGLQGDAGEYFVELVRFTQAKDVDKRSESYRRLTRFRGYRYAQRLDSNQARYHSEWYIPAIRELVAHRGFRADPRWLAAQMIPPIREKQAADALEVLQELGMLRIEENGTVSRPDTVVSTGPETGNLHVVHYHRAMMDKAIDSITHVPAAKRDISGVTFSVRKGLAPELKKRIREFRKELIAMEAKEGEADEVVHVAVQFFPLTSSTDEETSK